LFNQAPDLALLNNEYEQALIKQLSRYADTLKNAALNYEPNSLIDLKPLILIYDKLSIV
jgi:arginyl-tRNA synthetase